MEKKRLGRGLFKLALIPLGAMWYGVAIATLWNWFLSPLGVPSISWAIGFGISLLANALTPGHRRLRDVEEDETPVQEMMRDLIAILINPAFDLVFGYIVHLFVRR